MVEPTDFDICRGVKFIVENKNKWLDYSNNAKRLYKNRFNLAFKQPNSVFLCKKYCKNTICGICAVAKW